MSRPRVLIAAMAGVQGGPRTYAVSLALKLPAAAPDLDFLWLSEIPALELDPGILRSATLKLPHPVLRPLWDHAGVPVMLHRHRAALYHNTKNSLPIHCPVPSVVTIHDLAPFTVPETFPPFSRAYLTFHIRHAARRADRIIAVSESTRNDLVSILATPSERIHVVPNGVAENFFQVDPAAPAKVRERHRLPERYVLYTGTIQPRKNPHILLAAFLSLPERLRRDRALVFVGRLGWMSGDFPDLLAEARRHADVRLLSGFPDGDLPGLYAGAEVFVSPSSYEGFGLTVAEAMAAGTPVIAGNRSSLPEVVGDAGLLVPPEDPDEVAEALGKLLEDPALRAELTERGLRRATRFTWERAAAATAEVYREVLR